MIPEFDETKIADLIGVLQPAPETWVVTAQAIPRVRRQLEALLPMIERDAELRAAMERDLEAALQEVGVEPDPHIETALRRRLSNGS